MKVFVAAMCAAAIVVAAGTADASTKYAGVKGGLNIGSLTGDDVDGYDSHNGFVGGAYFGYDFAGQFGLRIDGLYIMGGGEGPFETEDGDTHDAIIKLNYIQFPVLLVMHIPANDALRFDIALGPTFSFNTTHDAEIPEHGETEEIPNVNSFELGAAIGGSLVYKLSSMSLMLEGRYYMGATNVIDVDPSDVKNRGIGIMAGVEFPLGAK